MVGALGGAVAGGVAAVRGARIGAERTAAATREAVRDQAAAEHGHWLREQRRDAFASFITATQTVTDASKAVTSMQHDQLIAFNESIQRLIKISSLITLMGPQEAITAAGRVIGAAENFRRCMWDESRITDHRSQESSDASDRTDEAADGYAEMVQRFIDVAQGVLGR
ncbi:hypothetical protein AB0919_31570 [Streptomyces sp. NPDC046994]|uniref:hypothetical protein n=1 Tax=Streptomyces sp. NPDC046994 TaxID=3155735 RepID=UPI003453C2B2